MFTGEYVGSKPAEDETQQVSFSWKTLFLLHFTVWSFIIFISVLIDNPVSYTKCVVCTQLFHHQIKGTMWLSKDNSSDILSTQLFTKLICFSPRCKTLKSVEKMLFCWQQTDKKKDNLPLWSPRVGTLCRGSGRRGACRWCRGRCGRRIPACWKAAAWSCGNRLSPWGFPERSPPPGVCPWSHTWTKRRTEMRGEKVFTRFKCKFYRVHAWISVSSQGIITVR